MANTHRENWRFKFYVFDASVIIPFPLLGFFPSLDTLKIILGWVLFCGILAIKRISLVDLFKLLWARRTRVSHARLKSDRH